jgi:hypothetical protein
VVNELDDRGWTNKLWHSKKGLPKGGRAFDKSSLHALLTNPIYCGKIKHKTDLYQGQQSSIKKSLIAFKHSCVRTASTAAIAYQANMAAC